MQFNSLSEIIAMGGYGAYVWSSVIIVLMVLVALLIHSATAKNRTLSFLRMEQQRADKIAHAKQAQSNQNIGSE